jgi:glycerol-3-phosphate dehydrogenase
MGEALGWGASRIAAETENYIARVEAERASQEQPDDAHADAVRLRVPDVETLH